MKKLLFTAAIAVLGFTSVNAQEEVTEGYKPVEGTVTTEVSLVGGLNNANFGLNGGQLKFRYFLKDDLALRGGLGLDNTTEEDITGASPTQVTTTTKTNDNSLRLGVEKHFAGSSRLSTYAGADLILGFGKSSVEASIENGDFNNFEQKDSGFGLGIFTGADYYIAKKVYLGVEAGLNFISRKTKDADFSSSIGGTSTSSTTPGSTGSDLETAVFGGVRIGFQF